MLLIDKLRLNKNIFNRQNKLNKKKIYKELHNNLTYKIKLLWNLNFLNIKSVIINNLLRLEKVDLLVGLFHLNRINNFSKLSIVDSNLLYIKTCNKISQILVKLRIIFTKIDKKILNYVTHKVKKANPIIQ